MNVKAKLDLTEKILIGAIAFVAIATIAFVTIHVMGVNEKFQEQMALADQYMQDMDYDKAEAAYLDAIDIKPKEADPYIKVADIRMARGDYPGARDIIDRGGKVCSHDKINPVVHNFEAYDNYYRFIAENWSNFTPVNKDVYNCSGLLSAFVKDLDNDGRAELVTIEVDYSSDVKDGLILDIGVYVDEDGTVKKLSDGSFTCGGNASAAISYYETELFLKQVGDSYYLVVTSDGGDIDTSREIVVVFSFDNCQVKKEHSCVFKHYGSVEFHLDRKKIIVYDAYGQGGDYKSAEAAMDASLAKYHEIFDQYGLEDKFGYEDNDDDWKTLAVSGVNMADTSETYLALIIMGDYDNGGDDYDLFYFEDYSGLRSGLKYIKNAKPEEENDDEEEPEDEEEADFADFEGDYTLSSGVGAWFNDLSLYEDGSFDGQYSDSEMGDTDATHPDGTVYESTYWGQFSTPEKVNDYTYKMTVEELEFDDSVGTSEVIDGVLHQYCKNDDLNEGDTVYIYLKGAPISELPSEFVEWYHMQSGEDVSGELPATGIYNEASLVGFVMQD